jgi:outer membrane protein
VALIPKEAMEFDIHNVFFGAVTLTQPIFMGGKIVAMNKIAGLASDIADQLYASEAQNVVYAVDGAYWTVVALKAKHELAKSYVNLLDTLRLDVQRMVEQGVATRSDLLSVEVKLNQANVDLTKVENGLSLSRMALAQVCGLPVNSQMQVEDEGSLEIDPHAEIANSYDMETVYAARHDLTALGLAGKVAEQEANVARAAMLPNVALIGAYSFSNPNMFDGFKKRFDGAFSVGVMVTIPIWHWGGNYYG